MDKNDVRIGHIEDAIARIETYTAGMDAVGFQHNAMMRDAVLRQLEIIGEAARHLTETEKKSIIALIGRESLECEIDSFMNTLKLIGISFGKLLFPTSRCLKMSLYSNCLFPSDFTNLPTNRLT